MTSLAIVAAIMLLVPIAEASPDMAEPEKAAFVSALVWRADGTGDYTFERGSLSGTSIDDDGAVEYTGSPGRYEVRAPYETDGLIYDITANWKFTGKVTLEVSATGNSADYAPVVNGVPLEMDESNAGAKLMWRATLAPDSTLTELKIVYNDLSGIIGDFGTPELSGFMFRKPVYVTGTTAGELFHYQLPIRVGESAGAADCNFYLIGSIQADFADVRFTQQDQETLIPYYLESITGEAPNRTALFWLNIPQLPEEGLLLYLYYGNAAAEGLSTEDVFDLFDDFNGASLDPDKWTAVMDAEFSVVELSDSLLRLDAAKVTTETYEFANGIIEYKARTTSGPIAAILRDNRVFYSSNVAGAEHSIAVGVDVKENTREPITLGTFYYYKIIANGEDLTFQRFDETGAVLLAEATSSLRAAEGGEAISLYAASQGLFVYYNWVRARKLAIPAPAVDATRTKAAQEEFPNIPEFHGMTVAPNGDLILSGPYAGSYISSLISLPFEARIIVPSWKVTTPLLQDDEAISIDISTKEDGLFKGNCENGVYYYASKGDFTEGDALRMRARLTPLSLRATEGGEAISISLLSLDFRPGAIDIVLANGGEYLKIGAEYDIVWDAAEYEPSYEFGIAYSTDGGESYKTIAEATENTGRYTWLVPDPSSLRGAAEDTTSSLRAAEGGEAISTYNKCVLKVYDALNEDIYDVSNDYFTIGEGVEAAGKEEEEAISEEETEEAVAEEEEEDQVGMQLYDVVVQFNDTDLHERGYIVIVRPSGNAWSDTERRSFLILQMYLTEEEAGALVREEEADSGMRDESGMPIMVLKRVNQKRVNLEKLGFSDISLNELEEKEAVEKLLTPKKLNPAEIIEDREQ